MTLITAFSSEAQVEEKDVSSISKFKKTNNSRLFEAKDFLLDAEEVFESEPEKALDLVHDALLIHIEENAMEEEADAYLLLGDFNFRLKEYQISLKNYEKAIAIYETIDKKSRRNKSLSNKLISANFEAGKTALLTEAYAKSRMYYEFCLKKVKKNGSEDDIVRAKTGIGLTYLKEGDDAKAETHLLDALKIEQDRNNENGVVLINLHLGALEEERNNEQKAINHYRTSQTKGVEIEDDKSVNEAYSNISNIYKNQNNIEQQINIAEEALEYNQQRNNSTEITEQNIGLASLMLEQDNNVEAIERLNSTIEIAEKTGDLKNKFRAVEVLVQAYKQEGNEAQEKVSFQEYENLVDSIKKIEANQIIDQSRKGEILENAQNKLTILEKDKELNERTIELLRKDRIITQENMRRQRIITYSLLSGFLILLVTSYLVFRSSREKKKANQLLALKSLRAQMNPHFIFNALNSVNSFISNSDEKEANRYLSEFSRLMRDVMENSQEDFIPLSKEINILELYLKLEHDRFKDKFDYTFEVDKNINVEETTIPPMLIQPYIENAVWHGLRYKEAKGMLNVKMLKENESTIITISDNGIGRKKSEELKTKNQKILKSTGIKNIDSRLKIIRDVYKTKLDIIIEDLDKQSQTGTIVTVRLLNDYKE